MPYRAGEHMPCPHCSDAVLSLATIMWIDRRSCAGCLGVWFDLDDLVELGDDLRVQLGRPYGEMQEQDNPRTCPRCSNPMALEVVTYKDDSVPIDVCHDCGVWFDKEELEPFLQLLMEIEDSERSPFSRVNRPWWAATLSFLINSLSAGGNKSAGWVK